MGLLERRRRGRRGGSHFCVTLSGAPHAGDNRIGDGDVVNTERTVVGDDADEVRKPPVVVCVAAAGALTATTPASPSAARTTTAAIASTRLL